MYILFLTLFLRWRSTNRLNIKQHKTDYSIMPKNEDKGLFSNLNLKVWIWLARIIKFSHYWGAAVRLTLRLYVILFDTNTTYQNAFTPIRVDLHLKCLNYSLWKGFKGGLILHVSKLESLFSGCFAHIWSRLRKWSQTMDNRWSEASVQLSYKCWYYIC